MTKLLFEQTAVGEDTNPEATGWHCVYYEDEQNGTGWGNSYYRKAENRWTMGDSMATQVVEYPTHWFKPLGTTVEKIQEDAIMKYKTRPISQDVCTQCGVIINMRDECHCEGLQS